MVQAGVILLYLVYILIIVYTIIINYEKTRKMKAMSESFLMAIHDIKNFSVNIDASGQLLRTIGGSGDNPITYNVLAKHLEVIISNCREMNGLIENLAKTIRFGKNKELALSRENIVDIVKEASKLNKYYAKKRSIDVDIQTKWSEIFVELDKETVIRILCNLIMNGIKYSNDGGKILITIIVDDNWAEIRVIDNGKGMASDELKRVFDMHYKESNYYDMEELSLGIGLYASCRMAKELGGELMVESAEGEGSIFTLKLPVKRMKENKQKSFKGLPFN